MCSHTLTAFIYTGLGSCPLLLKPLAACGLPESHSMVLVRHPAALPLLAAGLDSSTSSGGGSGGGTEGAAAPVVVQEFVNHGGLQYKAYAIGDKVRVVLD